VVHAQKLATFAHVFESTPGMELVLPQFGLFFWTVLIFLVIFFLLRRFAWKPILAALNEREKSIADALSQAEKARKEMQNLTAENEKLLTQARQERSEILAEANRIKDKIVAEAREQASADVARKMAESTQQIEQAKMAAMSALRQQAAALSLEIAEKVIRKQLSNDAEQQRLVNQLISEVKAN
jgi:F-type H+-transporting ATPase subunit b